MNHRLTALLALALSAGPLAGLAEAATYAFGPGSEIDYHVVHPMHHVTGVSHGLTGKVVVTNDHLVLPAKLTLQLISFNSGNSNRDNNAAGTLDVGRYPAAVLEIQAFKESARSKDAAGLHLAGTATGRLALHGLSHAVSVPLTGVVTASGLTVDGEFTLLLTDYGIPRPALMFKPIEDEVRVVIHGVAAGGT